MLSTLVLAMMAITCTSGKIYDRCELARELVNVHEAPMQQVGTWVCIAEHESRYNTSAVGMTNGDSSQDHGLFQISDLFWCSPPGKGWACGVTCAELEDDNIEDDFICAKRIYREHKKETGDGFNAWVVYRQHCSGGRSQSYVKDCFDQTTEKLATAKALTTSAPVSRFFSVLKPQESNLFDSRGSTATTKSTFQWFSQFGWS